MIKNAIIFFLSIIFVILFFELVLRLVYPSKEIVITRSHSDIYVPRMANISFSHKVLNTTANFDENGFRKKTIKCNDFEKKMDILLVGDSNIAGLFLNDEDALGEQIEKSYKSTEGCISVDSYGVSGFGPDLNFKAVNKLTTNKNYDLVIFHVFADNDFGDLVRSNSIKNNKLNDYGYCYVEPNWLEHLLTLRSLRKSIYILTGYYLNWQDATSSNSEYQNCEVVATWNTKNFANNMSQRAKVDKEIFLNDKRQIYMSGRYDIEFACHADKEMIAYVNNSLKVIDHELTKISLDRGFKLMYLLQPSEYDVTKNSLKETNSIVSSCPEKYRSYNLKNIFIDSIDQKNNILDLYDTFLECSKCYFTEAELSYDNHWSPYGVNLAAKLIVNSIN